jgi:hypothetical protein
VAEIARWFWLVSGKNLALLQPSDGVRVGAFSYLRLRHLRSETRKLSHSSKTSRAIINVVRAIFPLAKTKASGSSMSLAPIFFWFWNKRIT